MLVARLTGQGLGPRPLGFELSCRKGPRLPGQAVLAVQLVALLGCPLEPQDRPAARLIVQRFVLRRLALEQTGHTHFQCLASTVTAVPPGLPVFAGVAPSAWLFVHQTQLLETSEKQPAGLAHRPGKPPRLIAIQAIRQLDPIGAGAAAVAQTQP